MPADLVRVVGRVELWRSLRTGDHREALRRCWVARVELDEHFDRVRRARRGLPAGDEARRLVAGWLRDRDRANADGDLSTHGADLDEAALEAEVDLDRIRHAGDEVAPSVQAAVDQILIASGFRARPHRVDPIGTSRPVADVDARLPEHRDLSALVRRAMIEEQRRRLDRLSGRPATKVDPALAVHPGAGDRGITLDELIERFTADRALGLRDKTPAGRSPRPPLLRSRLSGEGTMYWDTWRDVVDNIIGGVAALAFFAGVIWLVLSHSDPSPDRGAAKECYRDWDGRTNPVVCE